MSPTPNPQLDQTGAGPSGNRVLDELKNTYAGLSPEAHQVLIDTGMHPFIKPAAPDLAQAAPPAAPAAAIPSSITAGTDTAPSPHPAFTPPRPSMQPLAVQSVAEAPPSVSGSPISLPANLPTSMANSGSAPASPSLSAPGVTSRALPTAFVPPHQAALNTQIQNKSGLANLPGIARIPLQILQGIAMATKPGQAILPWIPGTDPHHEAVIRGLEGVVNQEQRRNLEGAQAVNQTAEAQKGLAGPNVTNDFEAWRAQNPNAPISDWLELQQKFKPEHAETPFDVWRKQNPNAPAEDWLKAEEGTKRVPPNEYEDFKTGYLKAHPEATPDQVVSEFAKAKQTPQRTPVNEYEDFKTDYIKNHPNATAPEIQKEFAKVKQTPERPKTELVEVPDGKGGFTTKEVGGGASLPAGARTIGGVSSEATKNAEAEDTAKKAQADAKKDYQLAQSFANNPSPTNDLALVMHFIGATKPESIGRLRLNQNEINLVLGTRSSLGDLQAFAEKVMNGQKLTPKQRQDMLDTMKMIAGEGNAAAGGNVRKYNPATGKLE